MKKYTNKKIIYLVLILSAFLLAIIYSLSIFFKHPNSINDQNNLDFTENQPLKDLSEGNIDINKNIVKEDKTDIYKKEIDEEGLGYKLEVLGKNYEFKFKEGDTLESSMKKLDEEKEDFSFITSKHSFLGSFVEEINGIRGSSGKYWIYYINDKEAEMGISKYLLKEGDIISWRLE